MFYKSLEWANVIQINFYKQIPSSTILGTDVANGATYKLQKDKKENSISNLFYKFLLKTANFRGEPLGEPLLSKLTSKKWFQTLPPLAQLLLKILSINSQKPKIKRAFTMFLQFFSENRKKLIVNRYYRTLIPTKDLKFYHN